MASLVTRGSRMSDVTRQRLADYMKLLVIGGYEDEDYDLCVVAIAAFFCLTGEYCRVTGDEDDNIQTVKLTDIWQAELFWFGETNITEAIIVVDGVPQMNPQVRRRMLSSFCMSLCANFTQMTKMTARALTCGNLRDWSDTDKFIEQLRVFECIGMDATYEPETSTEDLVTGLFDFEELCYRHFSPRENDAAWRANLELGAGFIQLGASCLRRLEQDAYFPAMA